jgi:hypothetical protein
MTLFAQFHSVLPLWGLNASHCASGENEAAIAKVNNRANEISHFVLKTPGISCRGRRLKLT